MSQPDQQMWVRRLLAPSTWLLLGIAASWVGVAQLARAAEKANGRLQSSSIVYLMTWANATAWMCLAMPHMIRKHREVQVVHCMEKAKRLVTAEIFQLRHAFRFLAIALLTNFSYIAALHFLAASLNTAVFCTSPAFTLLFSAIWLAQGPPSCANVQSVLCSRQGLGVFLSVVGVFFIAEPWQTQVTQARSSARFAGVALSLAAALGTAVYQVYFKSTFGDRMRPDEVGLFLAYMGAIVFTLGGSLLAVSLISGLYALQLSLVPWGHVVATSACSAVFNFLIKFGLSRGTPVSVSVATQIGIPLNLMLDVFIVHANIDVAQALGTIAMLIAFSLQEGPSSSRPTSSGGSDAAARALLQTDAPEDVG